MLQKRFFLQFVLTVIILSGCHKSGPTEDLPITIISPSSTANTLQVETEASPIAIPTGTVTVTPTTEKSIEITTTLKTTEIMAYHFAEFIDPVINPTWSHNGQFVAFSTFEGIWVVNTTTWQNPELVCPLIGGVTNTLIWSPDDSKIAFAKERICESDEGCIVKTSVDQCDLATGQVSTFPGLERGVHIVYDWWDEQLLLSQHREVELLLYNTKTNQQQELLLPLFDSRYIFRTLGFVDRSHVIYMSSEDLPTVRITDINSLQSDEILSKGYIDNSSKFYVKGLSVSVSPDKRWIVWMDTTDLPNKEGIYVQLKLYDRETGFTTTLLKGDEFPGHDYNVTAWSFPSWSPESNQLVFLAAGREIWVLTLNVAEN